MTLYTGELGYDVPLNDRLLSMTDDMLGPSPMHIKYVLYVYDRFCIRLTNFPGPIGSVISKFTCTFMSLPYQRQHCLSHKFCPGHEWSGRYIIFNLWIS